VAVTDRCAKREAASDSFCTFLVSLSWRGMRVIVLLREAEHVVGVIVMRAVAANDTGDLGDFDDECSAGLPCGLALSSTGASGAAWVGGRPLGRRASSS
jgi:hypothetical protein